MQNDNLVLLNKLLTERKRKAISTLQKYGDGWLIITYGKHDDNFEYLTGVHTYGLSAILLTKDELIAFVSRLEKSFLEDKPNVDEIIDFYGLSDFDNKLKRTLRRFVGSRLLLNISSPEICYHASRLEYMLARRVMHYAEGLEIDIAPAGRFVLELRQTKTQTEFEALEKSVKITLDILDRAKEIIKPGITERELMSWLYHEAYKYGEPSFEPIVASGPNTANPHHISSSRKIKSDDVVYIDFGVKSLTMSADITRDYIVGSPSRKIVEVYKAVYKAQQAAIEVLRPGVPFSEPDLKARETFIELGYDPKKYYTHSLGHALGVDVHDVGPPLYETVRDKTIPDNVAYTVEPALYLFDQEPKFGIRIEDDIILVNGILKRLSHAPEEPEYIA